MQRVPQCWSRVVSLTFALRSTLDQRRSSSSAVDSRGCDPNSRGPKRIYKVFKSLQGRAYIHFPGLFWDRPRRSRTGGGGGLPLAISRREGCNQYIWAARPCRQDTKMMPQSGKRQSQCCECCSNTCVSDYVNDELDAIQLSRRMITWVMCQ